MQPKPMGTLSIIIVGGTIRIPERIPERSTTHRFGWSDTNLRLICSNRQNILHIIINCHIFSLTPEILHLLWPAWLSETTNLMLLKASTVSTVWSRLRSQKGKSIAGGSSGLNGHFQMDMDLSALTYIKLSGLRCNAYWSLRRYG